jgi:threonine synthase
VHGVSSTRDLFFFRSSLSLRFVHASYATLQLVRWVDYRYSVCPHGACAIHARHTIAADLTPTICVLTAHPAKFEKTVREATGAPAPTTLVVDALKVARRDHFTWLRKEGQHWRKAWVAQIKLAVESNQLAGSAKL